GTIATRSAGAERGGNFVAHWSLKSGCTVRLLLLNLKTLVHYLFLSGAKALRYRQMLSIVG
ncbi:MAG: hypothetical protein LUC87_03560, partial [Clostridiales bacterium]|nr:hypothetical protein [Clostridiales bacterium]